VGRLAGASSLAATGASPPDAEGHARPEGVGVGGAEASAGGNGFLSVSYAP
jgi:hypothetical protein